MTDRALQMLSLAMKAGKVVSGEFQTEEAVKGQKAFLVIVATDASDNTKKKFHDKCSYYGIPVRDAGSKDALGHAIGRASRATVAVTDRSFATGIMEKM